MPEPADDENAEGVRTFKFGRTFRLGKSLSDGVLPPEAIERLSAGGEPTESELATMRSALGEPDAIVEPGQVRRFEWKWDGQAGTDDGRAEPATYYEALSGRPDPNREFLVTSRRVLNAVVWIMAIGIPLGLVTLTVLTGQSPETIFFAGIFGAIVGMMIRTSFPRTPFD